ncbi:MAG: endonuclease MutS2 [Oscillospiraceae bacterium]
MNKYYTTLELNKILEKLSNECSNEKSKHMALNIEPCSDFETVKEELLKTSQAFELSVRFGTPPFLNFKDVCPSLKRANSGGILSLREMLNILQMLNQISMLYDWYKHCEDMQTDLDYLFSRLIPNKYLQNRLETSILTEDELSDSASPQLASIRKKITKAGINLRSSLDKMVRSETVQKCLQDNVVTIRDGRFVLPVKAEHRNDIKGLIHDTSATGQTIFIEPVSVVDANNEIKLLQSQEHDEIERIIEELSSLCGESAEIIIENYEVCATLNLYFAKSSLGTKMKATIPKLSNDGVINLRKARHPLIDKDKVVPINISLGEDYSCLIITGPNTGGKTVALKTVGLLTAMTMCGLMIPVSDGSQISVFENILVDIGDSQSIEQNLSTFSAHMTNVIKIIDTANDNSLIIIDELGSGTDPLEGSALAISIIEKLKSKNSKLLITTHYQELKMYALNTPMVENASCEFDIQTMKPTYRIIIGSPGKSNAFEISSSLGMPTDVIQNAKNLIDDDSKHFEKIIEKLENSRLELESKNQEIEKLRLEIKENSEKVKSELEEIQKTKDEELEKARQTAMTIIERTKAQSNSLIDELEQIRRQQNKENFGDMVSKAKKGTKSRFNKMYDTANPVTDRLAYNDNYTLPRELKQGDTVFITNLNKKGIVSSKPDKNGIVFVQIGIMRTKVNLENLRLIEKQDTKEQKSNGRVSKKIVSKVDRNVSMECDIRGRASDEGVYEMDAFIDNAIMSGLKTVTIIHGKGTGVLRKAVHNRLKNHPNVKSFRLGIYGEGEDGVTIVELK